jgi:hypothetical protein
MSASPAVFSLVFSSEHSNCAGPRIGELSGPRTLQPWVLALGSTPLDSCFNGSRESEGMESSRGRTDSPHYGRTAGHQQVFHSFWSRGSGPWIFYYATVLRNIWLKCRNFLSGAFFPVLISYFNNSQQAPDFDEDFCVNLYLWLCFWILKLHVFIFNCLNNKSHNSA